MYWKGKIQMIIKHLHTKQIRYGGVDLVVTVSEELGRPIGKVEKLKKNMKYNLGITELIPLKAFYLGFSLQNNAILPKVKDLVDESIERCGQIEEFSTKKVFYLILKCELNRNTDSIARDREIAKNFCDKSDHLGVFLNYMKIVDATELAKTVIGKKRGIVSPDQTSSMGGGVFPDSLDTMSMTKQEERSHHKGRWIHTDEGQIQINYTLPLRSLDLSEYDLAEKDKKFLYKASFSEILDKHFEDIDNFLSTYE